jgi:hypothetical protein
MSGSNFPADRPDLTIGTERRAQQWIRKLSLIAAPSDTEEGTELSNLHVTFSITKQLTTTPAVLEAKIYNLSKPTIQKLQQLKTIPAGQSVTLQSSGTSTGSGSGAGRIALQAGYEGNFGTIFRGDLMQVRVMWESPTDIYVELFAADGDYGHVWGRINTTLASGWTPNDVNDQTRKALGAYGLTVGDLPDVVPQKSGPRGKVCFGRARDLQRDLGRNFSTDSFVRDGNVEWLPASAYRTGEQVVVTSASGMIGVPQQTNFGITIRMLLNPSVGPGTLLKIDNKSIQHAQFTATVGETAANQYLKGNLSGDNDGVYKVLAVDHIGDTRGNDWYTIAICMAQTQTGPVQSVQPPEFYGYQY